MTGRSGTRPGHGSGLGYHPPGTPARVRSDVGPEECGWSSSTTGRRRRPPIAVASGWPCSIAVVAVTAGGIVLLGFRVANEGAEPAGQNWWFVTWFCVGLAYSVVGAALVARSSRRRLGAYFLVVGGSAVVSAISTQYRGYGSTEGRAMQVPGVRRSVDVGAPARRGGARRARHLGAAAAGLARRPPEPLRVPTRGGRHRPRDGRPADQRVGSPASAPTRSP